MCGIIGYVGQQQATPILLEGLRKLEYRGYDSAGIAGLGDGEGVAIADISHERLREARTRLPILAQRRARQLV